MILSSLLQGGGAPPGPASVTPFISSAAPAAGAVVLKPALRARHARLSLGVWTDLIKGFERPGWDPGFRLSLFPDADYAWRIDRVWVRPEGWTLWGSLTDAPRGGQVVLAFRSGRLSGNVWVHGIGKFEIRYAGEGIHRISEADPNNGFRCGNEEWPRTEASKWWVGAPAVYPQDETHACPDPQSLKIRHLLVVYTPSAVSKAGGLPAMLANIDQAWAATNMAYYNSGVSAEMQLVASRQVPYAETGNMSTDLSRLYDPSDGYLDEVQGWATTYGAEHVALVVSASSGGMAGLAYLPGKYTAILQDYEDMALPHELGHNFGCQHDREHSTSPGVAPYGYGHRFLAGGVTYITLMAYQPGNWILRFSNPLVLFLGQPTGVEADQSDSADNARLLNEAFIHAPYTGTHPQPQAQMTSPFDGQTLPSPSWVTLTASASAAVGAVAQVDFYVDNDLVGTDTSEPYQSSWNDPSPGTHWASVHVVDDAGAMRASCPVSFFVVLPTYTPTRTPSPTPTTDFSPTRTPTGTATMTRTRTPTLSRTPTATPTGSPTRSPTAAGTVTPPMIMFTPDTTVVPAWTPISCAAPMTWVDVSNTGAQADGDCAQTYPAMSWDGRYVVFGSQATNLGSPVWPGMTNIYVRDTVSGATELISRGMSGAPANGMSDMADISGNGRYVAFNSGASNLVPGDTNGMVDVFVLDRLTGVIERVNVSASGQQTVLSCLSPRINGDGRYVSFDSADPTLTADDANGASDVFVKDRWMGSVERVSAPPGWGDSNGQSFLPSISAGGRYVAFVSSATNLCMAFFVSGGFHVYVHDRLTHSTELLDRRPDGDPSHDSTNAYPWSISADGRYVGFGSDATDLTTGDVEGWMDAFVCDRTTGQVFRVSETSAGIGGNNDSDQPALSADGRHVAFLSYSTNLAAGASDSYANVYRSKWQQGAITVVNVAFGGGEANGHAYGGFLNADGSRTGFISYADNLAPGDLNGLPDVFNACVTELASTLTNTPTSSWSPTPTATDTQTATATSTDSPTATDTASPTPTRTPVVSPTFTGTLTASATTPKGTRTATPTATITPTGTIPTATLTPTSYVVIDVFPTVTLTPTSTFTTVPSLVPGAVGTPLAYPNPFRGEGTLSVAVELGKTAASIRLVLVTTAYRKIVEREFQGPFRPGFHSFTIDLETLPGGIPANGVYHLVVVLPSGEKSWGVLGLMR